MYLNNYIFILSLLPFCVAKETLPVFLLDVDSLINNVPLEQNPFASISNQQFNDIIQDSIKQYTVIIVFVEETLSIEDVAIKDEKGTPFAYLREEIAKHKVIYIPNVDAPIKPLTRLLRPIERNVFVLKPGQLFHSTENMEYFYVFFNDINNETRAEALRRHDLVIQHVYETTRKTSGGPVLAIYTGKVNPISGVSYQKGTMTVNDPYSPLQRGLILSSRSALYRFVGLTIDSGDRTRRAFFDDEGGGDSDAGGSDSSTDDSLTSKVKVGEYQLEFFFLLQSSRWRLDRIRLYEDNEWVGDRNLSSYIGAPYGQSYVCDEPLIFYNTRDHSAMIIPEYQIQPFRKDDLKETETSGDAAGGEDAPAGEGGDAEEAVRRRTDTADDSSLEFGPAVKCTPYFTIGILSGLTVTLLFLSILMSGIFCLYHCETNSNFDDPQAKQIVIPSTGD